MRTHAENDLETAGWTDLMCKASMDDPLGEPGQMRKTYPLLATRLQASVTEVTGHGDKPGHKVSDASRPVKLAARESLDQVVEAGGKLTMDAIELVHTNAKAMRQARTPLELMLAGQEIGFRNSRFALRCFFGPHRCMAERFAQAWQVRLKPEPVSARR